ncbi:MoxR family ATPase [Frankia sp. Cj3]|uniref:AAA family ATPase n=1 Tax=Frankia sp. Cj3 TaxID=2880976 RepID=UPI001EF450B4|nr:MoxR family ATPase [Frankia sp. Cj3]
MSVDPAPERADDAPATPPRPGWWLFQGTGDRIAPAERDRRWPPPPPWRTFQGGPVLPAPVDDEPETVRRLGAVPSRVLDPAQISVVNAAIYLRRPLLVTGRPGVGKSSLAYLIARELQLGRVLRWPVTSRTTLRAGLYDYDAIGRAQAVAPFRSAAGSRWHGRSRGEDSADAGGSGRGGPGVAPIGDFIQLGPLGTALLPHRLPRVLLIDEMDKGDFDLPNDLLNILEDGEFGIAELARMRQQGADVGVRTADPDGTAVVRDGTVRCHAFPIIVITSNGEREFSAAFLRRCARLDIPDLDTRRLTELVAAHFPADASGYQDLIARFEQRRQQVGGLAADQLLNAAHLAATGAADGDETVWNDLLEAVWHQLAPAADMR